MNFAYVCSVIGNKVFNNRATIGIINSVRDLDKIRQIVKDRYGIEFEKYANTHMDGWFEYSNVTDDRDITLLVERVDYL